MMSGQINIHVWWWMKLNEWHMFEAASEREVDVYETEEIDIEWKSSDLWEKWKAVKTHNIWFALKYIWT